MNREDNVRFEARASISRRDFLAAAGFGLAGTALTACTRPPKTLAYAPVRAVEGAVQGTSTLYAATCLACPSGCGLLSKNRDGRPIKLEGNPDHPLSRGGLCALAQAQILGLYDSHRLGGPRIRGAESSWEAMDKEVTRELRRVRSEGLELRVLSNTLTGPGTQDSVRNFLSSQGGGSWVVYDPLSSSAIADGYAKTHGARLIPGYDLSKARVIFAVEADFLGTWLSPVEFAAGYAPGRVPSGPHAEMTLHIQVESRLSLSGSRADQRVSVRYGSSGAVLADLLLRIASKSGKRFPRVSAPELDIPESTLESWAELLWDARGRSLVLCGAQDVEAQVLAAALNQLLDNEGQTLDLQRPSFQAQGDDGALEKLIAELRGGRVGALMILGANPVFDLPGGAELASLIQKLPLSLSTASHEDETAGFCQFLAPLCHPLETWSDAEPRDGLVSLSQPATPKLKNTRSLLESLASWSGRAGTALELLQASWKREVFNRSEGAASFEGFWDETLEKGFAKLRPRSAKPEAFRWNEVVFHQGEAPAGYSVSLYAKTAIGDGRGALNPWLQELPDPLTKAVWDNYAWMNEATAGKLGVKTGDVVRLEKEGLEPLEIPAMVLPGPHDGVLALALGYGRKGTERFSRVGPSWIFGRKTTGEDGRVGKNVSGWLSLKGGVLGYDRQGVAVSKTGKRRELAQTQDFHSLDLPENLAPRGAGHRPAVEATTLAAFRENPKSGSAEGQAPPAELWSEDHPGSGRRWALSVDLNRCTGCSACVVGCQAENNVPVVGYDEALRHREMHWIRLDRYFDGQSGRADFQPMMCQHCGHAPCETVCPVLATVHGEEGLNQQVYNRCVGTRYCANNCPYKVRRFNWFDYPHQDTFANLALNPDVTVRSRGVMEKCSFCVQRILEAKIEARRMGRDLKDGDIKTACEQSCPAQALTFGDILDKKSRVASNAGDPRNYQVLSELNLRSSVAYLRAVRNAPEGDGKEARHG